MVDEELMGSILDAYRNGEPVSLIARDLNINKKEVLSALSDYRKSNLENRKYTEEFKKFVAERDCKDALRRDTQNELGISRNFLINAVKKYGKVYKSDIESEFFVGVFHNEKEMKELMGCGNCRLNEVDSILNGIVTKGYYCIDTGEEFAVKGDKLYKSVWENIL